jgi:hypothetical protein
MSLAQPHNTETLRRRRLATTDGRATMPILALFRWQADADAVVAAYDREMENAPSVTLDQPARTLHVFARGEDRVVIVDLWESEEDLQRMLDDPEFQRNVDASGYPSEAEVEIFRVHATMP